MHRVLLVEDEAVIRSGLKKLIEEVVTGFKVEAEAANGREALQLLQHSPPDLLITDIRMAELNGLDLIRRVREQYPALAILIISGYSDFEYAKQAMRYGVSDYLLKPVDRSELAQFLDKLKRQWQPAANAEGGEDKSRPVIRRIKELVQQRLDQEITLQSIAEQVHLNAKYLSDLFKAETGQPFSDFVTEARMERAKKLLKESGLKIYEVATLCGYSSAKHFTVAFRQVVGLSPSEYRDQS